MNSRYSAIAIVFMMVIGSLAALPAAMGASGRTADNDNSYATATAITLPYSSSTQSVSSTDDQYDFYSFSASNGDVINASLTNYGANDFDLYIVSPQLLLLVRSEYGDPLETGMCLAPMSGTYYLLVGGYSGATTYTLNVSVQTPITVTGGNTYSQAISNVTADRGEFYRVWLSGNVSGKDDVAWFNLTTPALPVNFTLSVVDCRGNTSNLLNTSFSADPNEKCSVVASYSGWYYASVTPVTGAASFTLRVDVQPGGYSSDGNNEPVNLTTLGHNAVPTGRVDESQDHYDWYAYHLFQGDTLKIVTDRYNSTDVMNVSVYYPNMTYVYGGWNVVNGNPPTVPSNFQFTTPAVGAEGIYFICVQAFLPYRNSVVTDDNANMDYKLTLTSTNHAPTVSGGFSTLAMNEDETKTQEVASHFGDPDGDAVTFTTTSSTHITATYNAVTGLVEIVPAANWSGPETVQIIAKDAYNGQKSEPLNITVAPVNDPPYQKKSISTISMLQGGTDTSLDLSSIFGDPDLTYQDALTWSYSDNGALGVSITGNKVTISGPIAFFGEVNMQFSATDKAALTVSAPARIVVAHVNQPPTVKTIPANVTVAEDQSATLDLSKTFSDLDSDPITLAAQGQSLIGVVINPTTNVVTFTPSPNRSGFSEDIKFTAQDDKMATDTSQYVIVRVTVTPVNDAPVITTGSPSGETTITELESQEFSVTATDLETAIQDLNYTWYIDGKQASGATKTFTYTTSYDSAGTHAIKVLVDDGDLNAQRIWNITVKNKNRDPTDAKISEPGAGTSVREGTEVSFSGTAKDADNDVLTYKWIDGRNTLSEEQNFSTSKLTSGVHNIVLEVSDGTTAVRSKNLALTITANQKPVITVYTPQTGVSFDKGKKITFSVTASDPDGDTVTVNWTENGKLLGTGTQFMATLAPGNHNIICTVSDGKLEASQPIALEVKEASSGGNGLGGSMMPMLIGVIAIVAVLAIVGVVMMKRKKPPMTAAQLGAGQQAAPAAGPQQPYQQAPPQQQQYQETYQTPQQDYQQQPQDNYQQPQQDNAQQSQEQYVPPEMQDGGPGTQPQEQRPGGYQSPPPPPGMQPREPPL
jgi:hypothetical protein